VEFTNRFVEKISHRLKNMPVVAVQRDNGRIKLVRYKSSNLITPVVNDILNTDLSGTTCVLTKSNEEALQITGLLIKNGMKAKLIQSNEGFNLYNLLEVRSFLKYLNLSRDTYLISEETWTDAKRKLADEFSCSPNLELCQNIIKDFEATNPKNKYKSDLEIFIRESRMEDFFAEKLEAIFVSTIHKAKGREFDNVFIMLHGFNPKTDEELRQLYVAMTRAKRSLTVHYNGNYLDFIRADGLETFYDSNIYCPPGQLAMQLTHRDVVLDFFISRQNLIAELNSGDELGVDGDYCINSKGQKILKFSNRLKGKIQEMKQKNYFPKKAKIKFIVYWHEEDSEFEIRIVLPELYFERTDGYV